MTISHDGVSPVDPTAAVTLDVTLDSDHVLRSYADGSWALWHPSDCDATGGRCEWEAGPRPLPPAHESLVAQAERESSDARAHWDEIVARTKPDEAR